MVSRQLDDHASDIPLPFPRSRGPAQTPSSMAYPCTLKGPRQVELQFSDPSKRLRTWNSEPASSGAEDSSLRFAALGRKQRRGASGGGEEEPAWAIGPWDRSQLVGRDRRCRCTGAAYVDMAAAGATKPTVDGDWLAAGDGAVWLSDPAHKEIYRLDGQTGTIGARIRVEQMPCEAPEVAFGALWTASCIKRGLVRISATESRVTGFLPLKIPRLNHGEASIGAGYDAIWVVVDGRRIVLSRHGGASIDRSTGLAALGSRPGRSGSLRVSARIHVRSGSASVRAGEGEYGSRIPCTTLCRRSTLQRFASLRRQRFRTSRAFSRSARAAFGRSIRETVPSRGSTLRRVRRPARSRPTSSAPEATLLSVEAGSGLGVWMSC